MHRMITCGVQQHTYPAGKPDEDKLMLRKLSQQSKLPPEVASCGGVRLGQQSAFVSLCHLTVQNVMTLHRLRVKT